MLFLKLLLLMLFTQYHVYGCSNLECPNYTENSYALMYNHPEDCTKYCLCDNGKLIEMNCALGTRFSQEQQICVTLVDNPCEGLIRSKRQVQDPEDGCQLVECPPQNGMYALHLPNPLDCASFCKCDWGVAYYFACPSGLHFNAEIEVCDWPANANCKLPVTEPSTSTSTTTTTASPQTTDDDEVCSEDSSTTEANDATTVDEEVCSEESTTISDSTATQTTPTTTQITTTTPKPQITGCETVRCPANYTRLPNRNDCKSYCECVNQRATHRCCEAGLEFNSASQTCLPADIANCTLSGTTQYPSLCIESTTSELLITTPAIPNDPPVLTACSSVECPVDNKKYTYITANEDDCLSYCMCTEGTAKLVQCPQYLHFNNETKVCDYPENVNCESSTCNDPTNPQCLLNGCLDYKCTTKNLQHVEFFENLVSLSSYCFCNKGQIYAAICPLGLHFNKELKSCDYPIYLTNAV